MRRSFLFLSLNLVFCTNSRTDSENHYDFSKFNTDTVYGSRN